MGTRIAAGLALMAQLNTAGLNAHLDPETAAEKLPCVLIPPPEIDFTTRALTWRLKVLTDLEPGLAAWDALDNLVDQVEAVLPIETANPIGYQLLPNTRPLAAYDLRLTT